MKLLVPLIAFTFQMIAGEPDGYFQNYRNDCQPITAKAIASLAAREVFSWINPALRLKSKHVRFYIYKDSQPTKAIQLYANDIDGLYKSGFQPKSPVRFVAHGWGVSPSLCAIVDVKDAYLELGNLNVILVDWGDYALDPMYLRVISQIEIAAQQIYKFTKFLHEAADIEYKDMWLIGHSLGAHLIGMTGKLLKPDMFGVMYGLDPAGPLFRTDTTLNRLQPTDAHYVETIHTDVTFAGLDTDRLSHASFFVNWGLRQPHCTRNNIYEPEINCDHQGALYYFAESIRNRKAFGAIKCPSFDDMRTQNCGCGRDQCKAEVFMGGEPAVPKTGVYYVSTKDHPPFGYGDICIIKKPIQPRESI